MSKKRCIEIIEKVLSEGGRRYYLIGLVWGGPLGRNFIEIQGSRKSLSGRRSKVDKLMKKIYKK